MKAIFPSPIDGDLLKLVHLSNGFKTIPGLRPLKAGDICRAEASCRYRKRRLRQDSLSMSCVGQSGLQGLVSILLPWSPHGLRAFASGRLVSLITLLNLSPMLMLGVLLSKDWFEWADESKPLSAGTCLIFRLCLRSPTRTR